MTRFVLALLALRIIREVALGVGISWLSFMPLSAYR